MKKTLKPRPVGVSRVARNEKKRKKENNKEKRKKKKNARSRRIEESRERTMRSGVEVAVTDDRRHEDR